MYFSSLLYFLLSPAACISSLSFLSFLSTAFSFGIVVATLQDTLKSLRPQIDMYTNEQQPGRKLAQNWRYLDGAYIYPKPEYLSALHTK